MPEEEEVIIEEGSEVEVDAVTEASPEAEEEVA
jgi:hypothetical protein